MRLFKEVCDELEHNEQAFDNAVEKAVYCKGAIQVPEDIDAGEKNCECRECLQPITEKRFEMFARCCSNHCMRMRFGL